MQLIKSDININFIKNKGFAFIISATMIVASISSVILHRGLNYGVDFAGGTLIQLKFKSDVEIDQIKSELLAIGLQASTVQTFGKIENNEFLVKIVKPLPHTNLSKTMQNVFSSKIKNNPEIRRVEIVGPQVGKNLREKALLAIFYALLLIAVYISGRFEFKWTLSAILAISLISVVYFLTFLKIPIHLLTTTALTITLSMFWFMKLKYATGAIIALMHDVIIIIGVFSILNKEFSLPIVAALLTTVGYSLNDTIIVFDRIRENSSKYHEKSFSFIINKSINETLSRTVLTSLTTLAVVFSILVFGGSIIRDFAFALVIGIISGTYSSVYVAAPILLALKKNTRSFS